MQKLVVEMDAIIYNTGRRLYGDTDTSLIPATAHGFKIEGKDVVFTSKAGGKGDEVSRITSDSTEQLANWRRALEDAAELGGGDFELGNFVMDLISLEKTWLSNQYLNLRPGHWVRNAVNGTLALLGDDTVGFRSLADQQSDLARVMGSMPTDMTLFDAFGIGSMDDIRAKITAALGD